MAQGQGKQLYIALRLVGIGQIGQHGRWRKHDCGFALAGSHKIVQHLLQYFFVSGAVALGHFNKIHIQAGQFGLPGGIALRVQGCQQLVQRGGVQLAAQLHMLKAVRASRPEYAGLAVFRLARQQPGSPNHTCKAKAGEYGVIVVVGRALIQQGANILHVHAGAKLVQGADRAAVFIRQKAAHAGAELAFVSLARNKGQCVGLRAKSQTCSLSQGHAAEGPQGQPRIQPQLGRAAGIFNFFAAAGGHIKTHELRNLAPLQVNIEQIFTRVVGNGQVLRGSGHAGCTPQKEYEAGENQRQATP